MLLLYVAFAGKFSTLKLFLKTHWKLAVLGSIIGLGFGLLLYTYGTTMSTAPDAATLFSANPIVIAIIMMIWGKEKLSVKRIVGILIGFIGVVVIATQFQFQSLFQSQYFLGNLLIIIGMILWSIYVVMGKIIFTREQHCDPANPDCNIHFNTVTLLIGAICMLPFYLQPSQIGEITQSTWQTWVGLLYLGIITTGIGYLAFFKGLAMMEASKGINAFYFKPVLATIFSFLILGTIPSISLYIGIAIEIVALILVS